MDDHKPAGPGATLDDAAFLLAHFARSNAVPVDCLTDEGVAAREARSQAFEDAAYHCRALLAGDPRSLRMVARLRQEAAGQAPAVEMSTHAPHAWTKLSPGDTAHWFPQLLNELQPHARSGEAPTWTLRRLLADHTAVHAFLNGLGVPLAIEGAPLDTIQRVASLVGQIHAALSGDVEAPTGLQAKIRATLLREWKEGRAQVERAHAEREAAQVYVQHGGDIVRMPRGSYRRWLHACAAGRFSSPEDAEGAAVVGKNILFYRVDFGREDFARLMQEQGIAGAVFHATPPCCYDEPDGEPEGYDVDSGFAVCDGCGGVIGRWADGPGFMSFTAEERASRDATHPMERRNAPPRKKLTPFVADATEGADARWRYIAENYEAAISLGANPDRRVVVDRLIDGSGWFWIVWGRDEEILATSHEDCPCASPEEAEAGANVVAAEFYDLSEEG